MSFQTASLAMSKISPFRSFVWAWLVYSIFIVVLAITVWIPRGLAARMDFREMYAAGVLMRTDPSHLYDLTRQKQIEDALVSKNATLIPFGHMAYEAFPFAPLSLLKYSTAYLAMILLNLVLIAVCFFAAQAEFSKVVPLWQPRPGWIFFSFLPVTIALALGQDSLLMLLILLLTWKLLGRSRRFTAGLVLALLLFKPHVAVLIALFLAAQYGWRFVAGFATGGTLLTLLCVPFLGYAGLKAWFGVLWGISLVSDSNGAQQMAVATYPWSMPNLRGLLFTLLRARISTLTFLVILAVISLAILVWTMTTVRRLNARQALALSIVVTVLLSYSIEPSDCAVLLLPILLMEGAGDRLLAVCKHAILALPIAVLLLAPPTPPGAGFFLLSIPLLGAAYLMGRRSHPAI